MGAELQEKVSELAESLGVPGVAAAVFLDGEVSYAFFGVTGVENPLEVNEHTLFQTGSTGKTYTATAMMCLVERGLVDLDAPVKRYLPDFRLRDKHTEEHVTVLQLFTNTAGWDGDVMTNTGDGDDALDTYVALLADVEQVTPLGGGVSYNNAALSVAGQIIARVTGTTFEQAVRDLLFTPLGLTSSFYFRDEVMTRRFAVGHEQKASGEIVVRRPWGLARASAPAGGITSTVPDYLAWARFHLGDGTAPDGTRVLSAETLERMRTPVESMQGSALGDYVGISWLIQDLDGQRVVEHGGAMNGQYSELAMVPAKDFALTINVNCGPNGGELMDALKRWALSTYVGIDPSEPEPVPLGGDEAGAYLGSFETVAVTVEIVPADGGLLHALVAMKPETLAALAAAGEQPPEQPAFPLALLADRTAYVIASGPARGMKGYFARDADGTVTGVHLGGRLATRV